MRARARLWLWLGVLLACGLVQTSAASAKDAVVLRVGAAASLREVAEQMGTKFSQSQADTRVELTFGASSELAGQLRAGAPIDVILSADEEIPRALDRERLAGELRPFASNRLVVVARAELAPRVQKSSDLVSEAVRHIAMPPPTVPIGRYAREWLAKKGLLKVVETRVVQTENVRATLAAVDAGNADAAIVYATDVRTAASAKLAFAIPANEQPRIVYVALVAKATQHKDAARKFLDYVTSNEGEAMLKQAGFSAPGDAPAP